MGWWSDALLPRVLDRLGASRAVAADRERAAAGLAGRVLEVGFGSGPNLAHYPAAVYEVAAVEPSDVAWRLAARRVAAFPGVVERAGLDGARVPLPDGSCDAALITFTLCSVDDPAAVLAEVARVVRPGGAVHVLEHGLSPRPATARWQRRLDPLQGRVFGGCRLTRRPLDLLAAAGLEVVESDEGSAPGPRPWTYLTRAVARVPG